MKKHILLIVENNPVPHDIRVWNEAQAFHEFGYKVSVICPHSIKSPTRFEILNNISIYRHYIPFEANGKFGFILEYANALFWEFVLSVYIFVKHPFQVIHAANPPDHIFIIAAFYKLLKVKYVFDHHDITPENYLAKFSADDLFYKLLLVMEKLTFKTANIIISTNESYKNIALTRGNKGKEDVFVVRNGPNLSAIPMTTPDAKWKSGYTYLVAYVGNIGNQEGIDTLLKIVHYLVYQRGIMDTRFIIIGTGPHWQAMVQLAKAMNLEKYVMFTGYIPYKDFYEILATADLCINPEFRNEFTDKSTMIKIMDYMTFGKALVQFETTEGKVTAGDAAYYVKDNNVEHFAEAVVHLLRDSAMRNKMGDIGRKRIEKFLNWDEQKKVLKSAYTYLEHKN